MSSSGGRVARIQSLARTFPSLRGLHCIDTWKPVELDRFAAVGGASHGAQLAAKFLLAIWNPDKEWESGKFDVMEALSVWDVDHRKAFLVWAVDPWWA